MDPSKRESIFWLRDVNFCCYNIVRAGVIPYTVTPIGVFFCLGQDRKSSDLTDFGGGVKVEDTSPIDTAIREFREESKDSFHPNCYDPTTYNDCLCLIRSTHFRDDKDQHMLIIFKAVSPEQLTSSQISFTNQELDRLDEVECLYWCSEYQFQQIVYTSVSPLRMYRKVKNFISQCVSFPRLIHFLAYPPNSQTCKDYAKILARRKSSPKRVAMLAN